jgi:hypothetical protein
MVGSAALCVAGVNNHGIRTLNNDTIVCNSARIYGGAIDNDLRRVRSIAEAMAVLVLSVRSGLQRIRILPSQAVPIGDVEGKRQDISPIFGQFVEVSVRGRAG